MVQGRHSMWMGAEKAYRRPRRGSFVIGQMDDDVSLRKLCEYGCEAGCARRLLRRARNRDFEIKVD